MILMRLLIVFLLLSSVNAFARMYQWTEQSTGTTQLSGKPPAWYRSVADGPRVFVFDKGRLIDDTAVQVSEEVRQRMRQRAFVMAEEDRQKAMEKIAKSQELKQKYEKSGSDEPGKSLGDEEFEKMDLELLLAEKLLTQGTKEEEVEEQSPGDLTPDQLRELITNWEKLQTESAKKALEY